MSRPTPCPVCGLVETWQPVRNCEDLYEISNIGRVRSLGVIGRAGYGKLRKIRGRLLTSQRIALSRPGDQRYVMREVLFLEHFGLLTPPGAVRLFLDGDASHLCVANLSWEFNRLGYRPMHQKISRVRGSASSQKCVDCDGRAQEWSYTKSGLHEVKAEWNGSQVAYSLDPAEYEARCKKCHRGIDGWWVTRDARHREAA